MKDALIGIMRQEQKQLEALIAAELQSRQPDRARLEKLQNEFQDLRQQLDRYEH